MYPIDAIKVSPCSPSSLRVGVPVLLTICDIDPHAST